MFEFSRGDGFEYHTHRYKAIMLATHLVRVQHSVVSLRVRKEESQKMAK